MLCDEGFADGEVPPRWQGRQYLLCYSNIYQIKFALSAGPAIFHRLKDIAFLPKRDVGVGLALGLHTCPKLINVFVLSFRGNH